MLTKNQKEIRSRGIGSSEIAAVCGVSPFMQPIDVYCRKLGLKEEESNYNIDRGNYLEESLRKWYIAKVEPEIVEYAHTVLHPNKKLCIATPDGISRYNKDDIRCLEIKSPARTQSHWGIPGTDEIPEYYIPQVMWEMAATGLDLCDVAALIYGNLEIYHINYNNETFEMLYEIAEKFWKDHIEKQNPPDPDNSKSYEDYLKKMYPRQSLDLIEATADMNALIGQYDLFRKGRESLELQIREMENKIKAAIGEHEGIYGTWGKITWTNVRPRKTIDYQAIIRDYNISEEAVREKYTKNGNPTRRFMPKIKMELPNE